MSIMPDSWIRERAQKDRMIEPYVDSQRREGIISLHILSFMLKLGFPALVAA